MAKRGKSEIAAATGLKGWQEIAGFLGEPVSVVQRWAKEGMPVRRESRAVESSPDELNKWMGKESGKPVHVATETADLSEELKRGLAFVRREKRDAKEKSTYLQAKHLKKGASLAAGKKK
jgi:hypothetical protein